MIKLSVFENVYGMGIRRYLASRVKQVYPIKSLVLTARSKTENTRAKHHDSVERCIRIKKRQQVRE